MQIPRFAPRPPEDIPAPRDPPDTPFVAVFPIDWADLDPAQIAYTGRLPDFAVRAVDRWMVAQLGGGFFGLTRDYGIDTPFVHLSVDFTSPVTAEGDLACTVHVAEVGRTSAGFRVVARQGERECFSARLVAVFINQVAFEPAPIPPNVRATLEAHRDRLPAPAAPARG